MSRKKQKSENNLKPKSVKIPFVIPYKKNDLGTLRPNIPYLTHKHKQAGVYFIREKKGKKLVYIGFSKSALYKTVYRYFQKWKDISRTIQTRFTYPKKGYEVKIIFTTPDRAELLEKYLIMQYQPKDNSLKYDDYTTVKTDKEASKLIDETDTYTGSEKDFPF